MVLLPCTDSVRSIDDFAGIWEKQVKLWMWKCEELKRSIMKNYSETEQWHVWKRSRRSDVSKSYPVTVQFVPSVIYKSFRFRRLLPHVCTSAGWWQSIQNRQHTSPHLTIRNAKEYGQGSKDNKNSQQRIWNRINLNFSKFGCILHLTVAYVKNNNRVAYTKFSHA